MDEQKTSVPDGDFLCPCCSGKLYSECCSKFHSHDSWPSNAEEMVRARYSAYSLRKYEYVIETCDPTKKELKMDLEELRKNADEVTWKSLEILSPVRSDSVEGRSMELIDYRYVYHTSNATFQRSERGLFSHVEGKLYFYGGAELKPRPIRNEAKIGRNDPCPCGSGKKYKKCCGKGL